MSNNIFQKELTGITTAQTINAAGSYAIGNGQHLAFTNWQIQFVTSGTVSTGTATISVKSPGAADFADLSTTVDLAAGPLLVELTAVAEAIKITPDSFDGDSYSIYVTAS